MKYNRGYLHAYDSVSEARRSTVEYFDWYNRRRPHSILGRQTSEEAYNTMLPVMD
ncbi:integrase core domain-containing protein [Desulforhopalus singaporensis]|uniref:integrase core domain-containing protein n=1 Tax=Desulforhopalus singaporensis TaxID=91360 RepID=UPI000B8485D6